MIKGRVNEDNLPEIKIKLKGRKRPLKVILDTGFNGELCLPQKMIKKLCSVLCFREYFELAHGELVLADVYRVELTWFGKMREVEVVSTKAKEGLLGTELLRNCTLTFDFINKNIEIHQDYG
ncbi:MAG: hypothetical protein COS84_11390 [Armatimonadetes bacterium CG07_land_8_20_14_0_80_40_9]|nr:MAG: hypothetical protein COS84_11390 [Armatimonadetes bacterium CG07_land_8_20_14_0_80_40_9]